METEAFGTCASWEEPAPYVNQAEGGTERVKSEWEGSEDFVVVVDAAMEREAMSGMVGVAIIKMKAELDSLLRRVQGMEVCSHASMTTFDLRLQEIEAVHSTVQVQPRSSHLCKMLSTGRAVSAERRQDVRIPFRWGKPTERTNGS